MNLGNRVTIGITTKDRWDELAITVQQLVEIGFGDIPVIVIDDGSALAKANDVCKPLMNCTVVRENVRLGLVEERNRIAALTKTNYLVSLDDDSCFCNGQGLQEAVDYMDSHQDVAVLAFSKPFPAHQEKHTKSASRRPTRPISVREYRGCGHMLRVGVFRELGGYRGYFQHMCEERDYSLRVYGNGRRVVLFPNVLVVHRLSPLRRSRTQLSFYGARNSLLCWLLNLPLPLCMWRCARSIFGQLFACLRGRQTPAATIAGILWSVPVFWQHRADRRPLSRRSLNRYFALG